jgi:hypothetical protein
MADIADRQELEQLVYRLGRCLDERDFDSLRRIFTPEATVTTAKTATGHDAIVDQARERHSRDEGVQHIITNLITEPTTGADADQATGPGGDQAASAATGRANLLACFAHAGPADPAPFLLGEVYRFEFRRTPDGWRITNLTSTVTWTLTPPAAPR